MSETVISLSPTMNKRLNFDHDLMDSVDEYKISIEDSGDLIELAAQGCTQSRDALIMGYMWLCKDVVCRYRAHFPETVRMTDDLASETLLATTEFVNDMDEHVSQQEFFNRLQKHLVMRCAEYINYNRSDFSASLATNERRAAQGGELEYNFAQPIVDELTGLEDYNLDYVDLMDSLERLREVDKEHMHCLITLFLKQDYNIDEESLTDQERLAIDKLSELGISL